MAAYKCLYFSQKRTTRSSHKFGEQLCDSPSTDYQDSVTVASVVNPNFYQRQNLPQFGDKK